MFSPRQTKEKEVAFPGSVASINIAIDQIRVADILKVGIGIFHFLFACDSLLKVWYPLTYLQNVKRIS